MSGALLAAAVVLSALSCGGPPPVFIPVDTGTGAKIEVAVQRELFERVGKSPVRLAPSRWAQGEDGEWREETNELRGVLYEGVEESLARQLVAELKGAPPQPGLRAYLTHLGFDDDWNVLYDLAVVLDYSDDDLLALHDVSGVNYNITNAQVIEQIRAWREHMDLAFVAFDFDGFQAEISNREYDLATLAEENYRLCPDVIDQGYNSMAELKKALSEENVIWCWWD